MKDLVKALSLGSTICFCLLIPIVLGILMDKHFYTEPIGVLAGIVIGMGSAFLTLKELVK